MSNPIDRFNIASKTFDLAANRAQSAFDESTSPAIKDLVWAMGKYMMATNQAIVALSQQLEEINKNIDNVHEHLDGKPGPYTLRMR